MEAAEILGFSSISSPILYKYSHRMDFLEHRHGEVEEKATAY
jgi:hypothetical protein